MCDSTCYVNSIGDGQCMASKNKKELDIRCHLIAKENTLFCGKHKNTKMANIFRVSYVSYINNDSVDDNIITFLDYLDYNSNNNLMPFTESQIMMSYHYYRLDYYKLDKEQNIDVMRIQLYKFLKRVEYYTISENLKKIQYLQFIIKKKKDTILSYYHGNTYNTLDKCTNDTDFFNFDLLIDIPKRYIITYTDKQGFNYGFHIYSLYELIKREDKNPYSQHIFPDDLIILVIKYIDILTKWDTLLKMNIDYYKPNYKYTIRYYKDIYCNSGSDKDNTDNTDNTISLSGNIIEKAKDEINKLPIKNLSLIQCNGTFSKMTELGYQVDAAWIYNKTTYKLQLFIVYLFELWNISFNNYNLDSLNLNDKKYIMDSSSILLELVNNININININFNNSTINKYKYLQQVIKVLDHMLDAAPTLDYKNTVSIIIIKGLTILEPTKVINNNPWL